MGLFNPVIDPPTPEGKTASLFQSIVTDSRRVLYQQADIAKRSWKLVWQNPNQLTPQQVCDLIHAAAQQAGSTCAQVFAEHIATVAYVNTIAPGMIAAPFDAVPAGVTYAANEDGSLAITMPPA
jgi:hypothetical protein